MMPDESHAADQIAPVPPGPPDHRLKVKILNICGVGAPACLGQQPLGTLPVIGVTLVVPLPPPDHLTCNTRMLAAV